MQFYIEIICIFATRKKMVNFPNVQHKWAYLLKNMRKMAPEDEAKETDPIFKKLYEASRLSNLNIEEMGKYRKSVLEYEDVQNAIEYASKRSEARGEAKARRTMVAEMLCNGIEIPLICKISGLSEKEVLALDKDA